MKNIEKLNKLPTHIQNEVKEKLKGWTGCYVFQHKETSEYMVSTGVGITKQYDPWQLIESFENYEIYTQGEISKYANEYWNGVQWY